MDNTRSIENFEADGVARPLNSPRSLEACLRLGYNPTELRPLPIQAFRAPELTEQMVRRKAEHFEEKRQGKLVLHIYLTLICSVISSGNSKRVLRHRKN